MRFPFPVAILCFHRVLPASRRDSSDAPYFMRQTALDLDRFRALLDALERRDAVLSPEALLGWAEGAGVHSGLRADKPRSAPRPGVILTFDDGYADVLDIAAPEVARRGMQALLCVTTAVVSGRERAFPVDRWYAMTRCAVTRTGILDGIADGAWSFDIDRPEDRARFVDGPEKRAFVRAAPDAQRRMLETLRRALGAPRDPPTPPMLDIEGLRALTRRGFLLGSHGDRHALLPSLTEDEATQDLARSRASFTEHGLPPPSILAYPDGATCPRTEALAAAAGFQIGLALGSRFATERDPPMRLPRLIPTNDPSWFERRLIPLFTAEGC